MKQRRLRLIALLGAIEKSQTLLSQYWKINNWIILEHQNYFLRLYITRWILPRVSVIYNTFRHQWIDIINKTSLLCFSNKQYAVSLQTRKIQIKNFIFLIYKPVLTGFKKKIISMQNQLPINNGSALIRIKIVKATLLK